MKLILDINHVKLHLFPCVVEFPVSFNCILKQCFFDFRLTFKESGFYFYLASLSNLFPIPDNSAVIQDDGIEYAIVRECFRVVNGVYHCASLFIADEVFVIGRQEMKLWSRGRCVRAGFMHV